MPEIVNGVFIRLGGYHADLDWVVVKGLAENYSILAKPFFFNSHKMPFERLTENETRMDLLYQEVNHEELNVV